MPRALILMAGFVLLLCAGLLLTNAQESAASAHAATKACTDATTARAEARRLFGTASLPTNYDHCTYVQRWDTNGIAFAGITLVGGLGFIAFGLMRRPAIT